MTMANSKKPARNVGKQGGIYQEEGPNGGARPDYATVADNKLSPPTTKPGHGWTPVKKTPDSHR